MSPEFSSCLRPVVRWLSLRVLTSCARQGLHLATRSQEPVGCVGNEHRQPHPTPHVPLARAPYGRTRRHIVDGRLAAPIDPTPFSTQPTSPRGPPAHTCHYHGTRCICTLLSHRPLDVLSVLPPQGPVRSVDVFCQFDARGRGSGFTVDTAWHGLASKLGRSGSCFFSFLFGFTGFFALRGGFASLRVRAAAPHRTGVCVIVIYTPLSKVVW